MVQAKTHDPIRNREIFVLGLLLVRTSELRAEAVGGWPENKLRPHRAELRGGKTEPWWP